MNCSDRFAKATRGKMNYLLRCQGSPALQPHVAPYVDQSYPLFSAPIVDTSTVFNEINAFHQTSNLE